MRAAGPRAGRALGAREPQGCCGRGAGEPPGKLCRLLGGGIAPALLYRVFSLTLCVKDSLSRLFSRCGHVQSVDICDKPGPGEKKDKLASKFFDHKTLKVRLAWRRGILML